MTDTTLAPDLTVPPAEAPKRRGRPPGSKTRRPGSATRTRTPATDKADELAAAATSGLNPEAARGRSGKPSSNAKMQAALSGIYSSMGALTVAVALPLGQTRIVNVGAALCEHADNCAESLAAWADMNPKVKAALEKMTTGGGAALVIAAHIPLVMAAITPPAEGDAIASMLQGLGGLGDMLNPDGSLNIG